MPHILREMHLLSHGVSQHNVATDQVNIQTVRENIIYQQTLEFKPFLDFVSYYWRFCLYFATKPQSLNIYVGRKELLV